MPVVIVALPKDCKEGEARKVFDAILAVLTIDDIPALITMYDHISDKSPVNAKLIEIMQNAKDKESIMKLFDNIGGGVIAKYVNLSALSGEDKNEVRQRMFDNYIKDKEIDESMIDDLVRNGWLLKEQHTYNNKPVFEVVSPVASFNTQYKVVENDGKVRLYEISVSGAELGMRLYQAVRGLNIMNDGGSHDIINNEVNKDNVLTVIEMFNNISKSEGVNESLVEFLSNETRGYMKEVRKIVNLLLEIAAEKCPGGDPDVIALREVEINPLRDAKKTDEIIKRLLPKLY